MAFSRYERAPVLGFGAQYGTSFSHAVIRKGIKDGSIPFETIILHGFERLDHIAGKKYHDSSYWWVIAAASDIGWGLQLPPGTVIKIPNLSAVAKLIG